MRTRLDRASAKLDSATASDGTPVEGPRPERRVRTVPKLIIAARRRAGENCDPTEPTTSNIAPKPTETFRTL